ncbi:phosrestin-2-like [Tachypleus tridentatus]|uniref:phosrestin-2-like n=1 Tax=Tachypleus tridentatus TaxID=6853 RepID=UPI003FD3092D
MTLRIYKKQSPNNKLTLYVGTREVVLDDGQISPLDGVLLIDPSYQKDRKVYAMVLLTFRYGRKDEEIMGLKFYTEAVLDFKQVYPPIDTLDRHEELTSFQQILLRKLGSNSFPLTMSISPQAPASVRLQPARVYTGSPLGVAYDVMVFTASRTEEKPHKTSSVRMSFRCVHHFPPQPFTPLAVPSASVCKTFVFSPGKLELETILDREVYHHGDVMHVHVTVNNNSNKTVQKIKVYAIQYVYVCMFTNGRFKNLIGLAETEDGHPVSPGASLSRDFCFKLMSFLKYPIALAVEGGFNDDVMILATSSLNPRPKENNPYGVTVTYKVKIKAVLGYMDRPIVVRLPFKILSYKTADNFTFSTSPKKQRSLSTDDEGGVTEEIFQSGYI